MRPRGPHAAVTLDNGLILPRHFLGHEAHGGLLGLISVQRRAQIRLQALVITQNRQAIGQRTDQTGGGNCGKNDFSDWGNHTPQDMGLLCKQQHVGCTI